MTIAYRPTNQTQSISDVNQNPEAMTWAGAGQAERVKRTWTDQGTNYTATYAWSLLGLSGYANNGIDEPAQTSSVTSWIIRDPSGTPVAQRYSSGQEYYYLFDGQGDVVALEDPGVVQAAYDYCPTGNNPELPGTPQTPAAMANPLRQGATPYGDGTKMYVAPDGTITPDYSGVGTQTAGILNGDTVEYTALELPGGGGSSPQGGSCNPGAAAADAGAAVIGAGFAGASARARFRPGIAAGLGVASRGLGLLRGDIGGCPVVRHVEQQLLNPPSLYYPPPAPVLLPNPSSAGGNPGTAPNSLPTVPPAAVPLPNPN